MPIVFIGIGGQGEYGKGIIDNIAHGHFPDFSKEVAGLPNGNTTARQ